LTHLTGGKRKRKNPSLAVICPPELSVEKERGRGKRGNTQRTLLPLSVCSTEGRKKKKREERFPSAQTTFSSLL